MARGKRLNVNIITVLTTIIKKFNLIGYDLTKYSADTVKEFYRLNHTHQSFDFVKEKQKEYLSFSRKEMSVWNAFDFLNQLVDDSDPDTDLDQFQHLLQTSEAIRKDGHPDWMVMVGLLHDMGKVLCLFGEPQWAVVGDTFPVGCAYSDKIVYPEFFANNPDYTNPKYNTQYGVYSPNCGLRNVHMSWGHDEYIYQMVKHQIQKPLNYKYVHKFQLLLIQILHHEKL